MTGYTYRSAKRSSSRSSGSVMLTTMYQNTTNTNNHSLAEEGFLVIWCSDPLRVREQYRNNNSTEFFHDADGVQEGRVYVVAGVDFVRK